MKGDQHELKGGVRQVPLAGHIDNNENDDNEKNNGNKNSGNKNNGYKNNGKKYLLIAPQTGRAVTETQIHHELEESGTVSVDGHDLPGSFRQKITYNVDPHQGERQMYTLIDRAKTCHQNVRYRCRCGETLEPQGRLVIGANAIYACVSFFNLMSEILQS